MGGRHRERMLRPIAGPPDQYPLPGQHQLRAPAASWHQRDQDEWAGRFTACSPGRQWWRRRAALVNSVPPAARCDLCSLGDCADEGIGAGVQGREEQAEGPRADRADAGAGGETQAAP